MTGRLHTALALVSREGEASVIHAGSESGQLSEPIGGSANLLEQGQATGLANRLLPG